MSKFNIDFFELSFLAEACIPPRPIARMCFWQDLTDKHWFNMSEDERANLFSWIQRNPYYEESLANQEETQIFHARFNPDNQYIVKTSYGDENETHHSFKMKDKYYKNRTTYIADEYIKDVIKLEHHGESCR